MERFVENMQTFVKMETKFLQFWTQDGNPEQKIWTARTKTNTCVNN